MRMRSTGLGKKELLCEGEGFSKEGDYLILSVQTTDPVRWHVRICLDGNDMMQLLWMMIKKPFAVLSILLTSRKRNKELPDY